MDDGEKGTPIKVKFSDKRRVRSEGAVTDSDDSSGARASDVTSTPSTQTVSEGGLRNAPSSPERDREQAQESPRTSEDAGMSSNAEGEAGLGALGVEGVAAVAEENNFLDDLRRVQADFDNYRKRMLREQTQLAQRASAKLIERLLPVLDNFESAIAHGEGGTGVELVYKELRRVLEEEGLEEIPSEGNPFDPRVHEAFEAVEDAGVDEPTVRSVMRRGYRLKDQIIRPSMVSVARPPEEPAQQEPSGAGETGSQSQDPTSQDAGTEDPNQPDAAEG